MMQVNFHAIGGRGGALLLALSAILATVYLFEDFGLGLPYPVNAAIKMMSVALLAGHALLRRCPVLALGLFLGSLGDLFLALQPQQLAAGILAFGLGHLVYLGLFARLRVERGGRGGWSGIAALALAAYGLAMLGWLQPHFGELRVAASVYNGLILVMAALAMLSRASWLAVAGAVLFVVSDSVLAARLFAGELMWAGWVVWVTYYGAQVLIALGLEQDLHAHRETTPPSPPRV